MLGHFVQSTQISNQCCKLIYEHNKTMFMIDERRRATNNDACIYELGCMHF